MPGFEITDTNIELSRWDAMTLRRAINSAKLEELQQPAVGTALGILLLNLTSIVLLIAAAKFAALWWVTALVVVLIAGRQHAMLVMMHEAAHGMLHKVRWVNDLVSNLFLTFPLFMSTALYRAHHLQHHRYVNTDRDPDLNDSELPPNGLLFLLQLFGDLLGLRSLRMLTSINDFGVFGLFSKNLNKTTVLRREQWLFVGVALLVLAILTFTGAWLEVLIFWIVPMWFILPPVLHLRAVAEHAGRVDADYEAHARSVDPYPLERLLICPLNINLHLEHHIFPDIPAHRLPQVSRLLADIPSLGTKLRRNRGYLLGRNSVLAELYAPKQQVRT
ncbi:MAG: fatty acid desaturase [Rhodobacteraceae bacterium]|nr:fatty acid desaturase [Paracoccaceae bacterium]